VYTHVHVTPADLRNPTLIREYRGRLIADVVTGKVDVRHIAPLARELVADEQEPLEDGEELIEDESQDAADLEPDEAAVDADN
jgi:type I restriction enzyme S subunit